MILLYTLNQTNEHDLCGWPQAFVNPPPPPIILLHFYYSYTYNYNYLLQPILVLLHSKKQNLVSTTVDVSSVM